jgi:hypothetical protein
VIYTTDIQDDGEFWSRLEYAASRWLSSASDLTLRHFWIDGFLPDAFRRTNAGAEIEGVAWVGNGSRKQEQYRFRARVRWQVVDESRDDFEIERIAFDHVNRTLEVKVGKSEANKAFDPTLRSAPRDSGGSSED